MDKQTVTLHEFWSEKLYQRWVVLESGEILIMEKVENPLFVKFPGREMEFAYTGEAVVSTVGNVGELPNASEVVK